MYGMCVCVCVFVLSACTCMACVHTYIRGSWCVSCAVC